MKNVEGIKPTITIMDINKASVGQIYTDKSPYAQMDNTRAFFSSADWTYDQAGYTYNSPDREYGGLVQLGGIPRI